MTEPVTLADQLADMFNRLHEFMAQMAVALSEMGPQFASLARYLEHMDMEGLIADIAVRRELTTEADIRRVYFDYEVGEWFIQQHNWRRIMVPAD